MSASQSNLSSDPHYGFDLVVAVTQLSINAAMKNLLDGLSSPEVTVCYVFDEKDNLVPIDFQTLLKNANGSDPFKVAAGASPSTDKDLINLTNANFAGAVRAQIGLPNMPATAIPPIVTLGPQATAPVLFNLLCSEFVITGFQFGARGKVTWINQAQPSGSGNPWYFSAHVDLNSAPATPQDSLPAAVQNRANQLNATNNAFTIQKLFLDLDTALLSSSPTIVGIDPGWPVWNLITRVFLGAYFTQLKQKGNPVLNYSFTVNAPLPTTLQLGAVSRECLPLLQNGQPIINPTPKQKEATTLVYLGSTTATAPVPVTFPWNWVELSEVSALAGVAAVRRDVFFTFFLKLLNQDVAPLCIDPNLEMGNDGLTLWAKYTVTPSTSPSYFKPVSQIQPPGTDGFTTMATIHYAHNSHNSHSLALGVASETSDFNYELTGAVGVSGNQIKIQVRAAVWMYFGHDETAFAHYDDLPGANYYEKTRTIIYTLGVNQQGQLQVIPSANVVDTSAPWNLHFKGVIRDETVTTGLKAVQDYFSKYIDRIFSNYDAYITNEINGYHGWVFPGNDAFVFKNLSFSAGQDLIAQLTYVQPN